MDYLFRGIHHRAISNPAAHFCKLGLILEPKPVVDGPTRDGFPFEILIALGEPFSGNVCVELDLMGLPVVRGNFHGKEGERDRLVH